MMKSSLIPCVVALLALGGCGGAENGSVGNDERSDSNYQRGLSEYTAGRIDQAVAAFSEAVKSNPSNSSARFQLGVLLQEHKKDYLAALCCYREYLNIAASSDKADIARERMETSEKLLLAEMAKKNSLINSSELIKEMQQVKSELESAKKENAKLTETLASTEKKLGVLEREKASLSAMIKRMGDCSDENVSARPIVLAGKSGTDEDPEGIKKAAPKKIASVEEDDEKPLVLNPEAKELFESEEREARNGATILPEKKSEAKVSDEGEKPKKLSLPDAFYKSKDKTAKERPSGRPEYYIVQHGDTLRAIAKKFYGDKKEWVKIREANKARVSMTGEIKAGDKIRLP